MRRKDLTSLPVLFLLSLTVTRAGIAQTAVRRLYVLEDIEHQQWCGFTRRSVWHTAVNKTSALRVGTVTYVGDRISVIRVTEEGESGDWVVYDRYFFDRSGMLRTLTRTINVLPGDRSVKQVFAIHDGLAKQQSTTSLQLSTAQPVAPSEDWFPDIPVITEVRAFPFAPLIGNRRFAVSSKGRMCVTVIRQQ